MRFNSNAPTCPLAIVIVERSNDSFYAIPLVEKKAKSKYIKKKSNNNNETRNPTR